MSYIRTTGLSLLAALCTGAAPAVAAPFKCPHVGGDFVFGMEANVNSLDQMVTAALSTKDIALNILESLIIRDENNDIIADLAQSFTESPDHMTYTFKLRQGVQFQNGKTMTSADVAASFDRYNKVGLERNMLDDVAGWDTPDADTFVVHMKKVQPTFLTLLSSPEAPIVIIPAEQKDVPALQLKPIGTGPYQLVQSIPGSYVKLKRFDGYQPNSNFQQQTGYGGYKQACFDTVTFRIVTEPGARIAGIETGELQGIENVPTTSVPQLRKNKNITLMSLENWWVLAAEPNTASPPTDNLDFRKAMQAALNMTPIMQAATDGNFRLNVGFTYPGQADYTEAGKSTYNQNDPTLVKKYLAQAGYKNEPVILLTNKDYPVMYNSALVVQQQLQAVGINAQMLVMDWPSAVALSHNHEKGWNLFFDAYGQPSVGPLSVMQLFSRPKPLYYPPAGKPDPKVAELWGQMNSLPTAEARQEAFAALQKYILDQAYSLPFGSLTRVQAVRSDVKGFVPFRIPRMANVWFEK